ncbi:flagellar assembly protein FliX [Hyphobacterium sp. HN65]|uniref:Flagellar assembly protein FliX n=1 Tax=Hyphobacterium lacteum TaxID=3116575 RepID=A0ABU7LRH5_9PROT|nr:flagellar assembly protein FliX [Hyphobacterium sp. HN65]MEE2526194.1 flagellar assembly protein FliX [Hyphobacterium sp. HN65]
MKVTGPGSTASVSSKRRTGKTGGEGFSVETPQAGGQASVAATSGASALTSVDAILALQSVGDFTEAKKKATERAFTMLDVLDDLKLALLDGGIPRAKLVALMDLLQSRRDNTQDPRLEQMLDEVETRAAVELAKLEA